MAKQSSSSREKLSSASSTSFHSPPSSTLSPSVTAEELSLGHSAPNGDSTPPLMTSTPNYSPNSPTATAYICSTNNQPIMSTGVDSLDSCTPSSSSILGLCRGLSPSILITKEHLPVGINSGSLPRKPVFTNSLLLKDNVDKDFHPCMCDDSGELAESTNSPLISPKFPTAQNPKRPPAPKDNKPTQTFDCLSSLSSSIFKLKNYSTTLNQQPPSFGSTILFTDESSPFSNDKKCLAHPSKSTSMDPNFNNNSSTIEHTLSASTRSNNTSTGLDLPKTIPSLAPISSIQDSGYNDSETNYCYICEKKIPILSFKCKCGFYFCNKHRHAELHNCTFDYKAEKKDYLRKNVTTVIADKVRKI